MSSLASLTLYLWGIAGCTAMVVAILAGLAFKPLNTALSAFNITARQQWLWCLVLLPYAVGVYVAFVTMVPSMSHVFGLTLDHCHAHSNSHSHFCWYHPPHFVWNSWPGLATMFLSALACWKIASGLLRHIRGIQQARTLMAFAERQHDGTYRIDSDIPGAFTLGLLKPQILVSQILANALTPAELGIVIQHERAHQCRRDPLRLWLFQAALSIYLPRLRQPLLAAMELAIEQQADIHAARASTDSFQVADTLIKVNRLASRCRTRSPGGLACAFGAGNIEARIHLLLASDRGLAFPLLGITLLALACCATGIFYADALHHAIESLLYHPETLSFH